MAELKKAVGKRSITDTNLLLTITIVVFAAMYLFAMFGLGRGFLRWQTFFNILNTNASLIITAIGLSIVMICGSIDISVGGVVGLVTMCCAVNLDYQGGDPVTALAIALCIGLAFGVVQGFLVAYLEIQPFIVTLGRHVLRPRPDHDHPRRALQRAERGVPRPQGHAHHDSVPRVS